MLPKNTSVKYAAMKFELFFQNVGAFWTEGRNGES